MYRTGHLKCFRPGFHCGVSSLERPAQEPRGVLDCVIDFLLAKGFWVFVLLERAHEQVHLVTFFGEPVTTGFHPGITEKPCIVTRLPVLNDPSVAEVVKYKLYKDTFPEISRKFFARNGIIPAM